jgi:UMF1 family MFS transporter
MQTASKKVINGWAMYDWANSVFNLVITSTIFPAYYESMTGDGNDLTDQDKVIFLGREFVNTSLYNYAMALAFLVVAAMSPLLSSIADFRGNKKSFLRFFMTMGSIACSALFFYGSDNLGFGLLCLIVATIGFWSSIVFYNSFLPEIAAPEDRDRVSAKGFAYGYTGSVILQIVCFVFVLMNDKLGITKGFASQLSFLLVGIWWFSFASFSLRRLPNSIPAGRTNQNSILTNGYKELRKVWNQLKEIPVLKRYLTSFFFFNMGVQTVMLAATLYGKSELAIPTENLIIAILIIQLIAIPGAFTISKLSSKIGNLKALMVCVLVWVGICYYGYTIPKHDVVQFYIIACIIGFVMGGIQALSRSTYAKLMPVTKDTTSFFSFYDVSEKIGIVSGLFFFGFLAESTGSQRISVLMLMVFFIIGLLLLLYTRAAEKKTMSA